MQGRPTVIRCWLLSVLLLAAVGCAPQPGVPAAGQPAETSVSATASPAPLVPAPATPSPKAGPLAKINLAFPSDTLNYTPVYVASSKGYFKDLGLDVQVTMVQGATAANAALVAGDSDLITAGADVLIQLREAGKESLAVYSLGFKQTMFLVVNKKFAEQRGVDLNASLQEKVSKLKGITLGAPSLGGKTEMYTRWIMRRGGLKDEDVSVIKVGAGSAMVAAMEGNQIDGFVASPPAPQEVALRGQAVLLVNPVDVPEFDNNVATFLVAVKGRAEQRAEEFKRLATALDRAKQEIQRDFDGTLRVLQERFPKMQEEALRESLRFYVSAYGTHGRMDEQGWRNTLRFVTETTEGNPQFNPKEGLYWTNQYLP